MTKLWRIPKKNFGLRPTYLPNPRSGILMPKPPCRFMSALLKSYTHLYPNEFLQFIGLMEGTQRTRYLDINAQISVVLED